MACGTPVVATAGAVAGIEAVHDQHLLVANDAAAFAAMVVRLLHDPHLTERLTAAARRHVEDHHSWETSVAQLASLYEAVGSADPR